MRPEPTLGSDLEALLCMLVGIRSLDDIGTEDGSKDFETVSMMVWNRVKMMDFRYYRDTRAWVLRGKQRVRLVAGNTAVATMAGSSITPTAPAGNGKGKGVDRDGMGPPIRWTTNLTIPSPPSENCTSGFPVLRWTPINMEPSWMANRSLDSVQTKSVASAPKEVEKVHTASVFPTLIISSPQQPLSQHTPSPPPQATPLSLPQLAGERHVTDLLSLTLKVAEQQKEIESLQAKLGNFQRGFEMLRLMHKQMGKKRADELVRKNWIRLMLGRAFKEAYGGSGSQDADGDDGRAFGMGGQEREEVGGQTEVQREDKAAYGEIQDDNQERGRGNIPGPIRRVPSAMSIRRLKLKQTRPASGAIIREMKDEREYPPSAWMDTTLHGGREMSIDPAPPSLPVPPSGFFRPLSNPWPNPPLHADAAPAADALAVFGTGSEESRSGNAPVEGVAAGDGEGPLGSAPRALLPLGVRVPSFTQPPKLQRIPNTRKGPKAADPSPRKGAILGVTRHTPRVSPYPLPGTDSFDAAKSQAGNRQAGKKQRRKAARREKLMEQARKEREKEREKEYEWKRMGMQLTMAMEKIREMEESIAQGRANSDRDEVYERRRRLGNFGSGNGGGDGVGVGGGGWGSEDEDEDVDYYTDSFNDDAYVPHSIPPRQLGEEWDVERGRGGIPPPSVEAPQGLENRSLGSLPSPVYMVNYTSSYERRADGAGARSGGSGGGSGGESRGWEWSGDGTVMDPIVL